MGVRLVSRLSGFPLFVLFVLCFVSGCASTKGVKNVSSSYRPDRKSTQEEMLYQQLQIFGDVLSVVQRSHVILKGEYFEEPDMEKFIQGAIKGGLQTLDPLSSYLTPEKVKLMEARTRGVLGRTGIELEVKDGVLTTVGTIEGTPAFRAGLRAGDKILKIDNESTKDMNKMDAVKRLEGEPGTKVSVAIMRDSFPEPKVYTLTLEIIPDVFFRAMEKGVLYVKILEFRSGTSMELGKALRSETEQGKEIRGLVLDLRDNQGGLLDEVVKILDTFIDSGIIIFTDGRLESQRFKYSAHREGTYTKFPIVVLVNARTAAGAEMVAGTLKANGRGTIVGSTTSGKGSIQTLLPLADGSVLRLTTAIVFIGKTGDPIEGVGVEPDIVVEGNDSEDLPLKSAIGFLR